MVVRVVKIGREEAFLCHPKPLRSVEALFILLLEVLEDPKYQDHLKLKDQTGY